MAILFNDEYDYIQCVCGCRVLVEESSYTYKKEQGRLGEIIKRSFVGKVLKCTKCNNILDYKFDKNAVIID
jgi:hypothetical protein